MLAALDGDALIVPAAPELFIGGDTDVRYVPAADLYYLTGYIEPQAVLVLCASAEHAFTLFVRPRDAERELWTGVRGGVDAARDRFGADAAYPLSDLQARLPKLLENAERVFAPLDAGRREVDEALRHALAQAGRSRQRTGRGIHTVTDPSALLAPMRVRKDATEVAAIRAAADITISAFDDVARGLTSLGHEYEVEAGIEYGFRRRGAHGPAFPTIAASGANATVLHYTANEAALHAGDLLLVDAGARARMYCADITRTWPVGGRFTAEQRAVYDAVVAAHDTFIDRIGPGRSLGDAEDAALRVLIQGMIDLHLLAGAIDDIVEKRDYRRYFPHRMSHWLGLEVHDTGSYAVNGQPVDLEEGMVLTVEPGLYIPAGDTTAPAALRGMGVRLEDDVLVTGDGADVLTSGLPLRAADVEARLGG